MTEAIWVRFKKIAQRNAEKAAIIEPASNKKLSYQELALRAEDFAKYLAKRSEETLVFIGEPDLEALPIVMACAAANWCFVPLSDREPEDRLLKAVSQLPGPIILVSSGGFLGMETINLESPLKELGLCWQILRTQNKKESPLPFLVTHSSGSTGLPKAIAFSQERKLHRTLQSIELFSVTEADVILSPTPLHHSLGQRHFFISIMTGATLVKSYPFSPATWIEAVTKFNVTFAIPVSTHLKILQSTILKNPEILNSFRCIVTSSAPAEPEFKRAILDSAEFEFWEIYGMSETACATSVRYEKGHPTDSLGLAIQGTKIRISGDNPDGSGEIEVLSDCLCDGYWGDPERWSDALTEDGYFRSGDLGRLDDKGHLIYLGRCDESFTSAGLSVFPAEIEGIIAELGEIIDCVAFGIPDDIFGNLVSLAFIPRGDLRDQDLIKHARTKLPKYMWPVRLFRCQEFPLLPSGKVNRKALVEELSGKLNTKS